MREQSNTLRNQGRAGWMETSTKMLVGGAAALTALALLSGSRLQRFSKEFVLNTNARIQSIDWSGMVIAVDVTFKNPTDATLRLKHPFISIFDSPANLAANLPLLSSKVESTVYTIKPNSETTLKPILLTIDLFDINLALSVKGLVRNYLNGLPVTLYGRALTQVNGTVPIAQEFQSSFQKGRKSATVQTKATGQSAKSTTKIAR